MNRWIGNAILLVAAGVCATSVLAQGTRVYPNRALRMIISFPPGGSTDLLARTVAQKMQDGLGQSVLIENRPGGGTNIGAEAAAKAAPDGYTLYLGIDATMVMNPWLPTKPAFDPVRDFAPISNLAVQCVIFVGSNKAPGKTLAALALHAKANPGRLTFGGSNILTQLLGEQFRTLAAIDIQYVPFQGAPQQLQSLFSGDIDMAVVGVMPYANYVRDGKLIGLATTGPKREPRAPDMQTVRESGYPGLEGCNWLALFAPSGTPQPIIDRLNAEVGAALGDAEVKQRLTSSGMEPSPTSSAALGEMVRTDLAKWGPVVQRANLKR